MKENKNKSITLMLVAVITLLALVIGATFAYFLASGNSGSSTNVNVTTYTSDLLTFEVGNDIAVYADQTSFASGKGNATGSTFAKAILTANNKTNTATKNYYMYLNVSNNTFTYTQNENTPELLLTITDASGNAITSISGLTYKTVTDGKGASISGFDITTKSGLITLFDNREITATPAKTEQWNVTVTFVNYNANQTGNAGKSFDAKLMIQQKKLGNQTLAEYVISQYTGTQGENSIYHHNSTLANGAGDNSYRYAGANPNNYVCFGSDASPCPYDNLYRIIGVFGENNHGVSGNQLVKLIKYYSASSNLLGIYGLYSGNDKYIWSPSSSLCPNSTAYNSNNGIYQLANNNKIAAADVGGCNMWKYSQLNTVNLNTNFLNNIDLKWRNTIEDTTWKVGGHSTEAVTAKAMFTAEITNATKTYGPSDGTSKIGLMYASDYMFAVPQDKWTLTGYNYNDATKDYRAAKDLNWLYLSSSEWTITPYSSSSDNYVFYLAGDGRLSFGFVNLGNVTRPVFYLKSSVTYASGEGTQSDPIRIAV